MILEGQTSHIKNIGATNPFLAWEEGFFVQKLNERLMNEIKIFMVSDSLSFQALESIFRLTNAHFKGCDFELVKIPNVKTAKRALEIVNEAKEFERSLILYSVFFEEVKEVFQMIGPTYNIECVDVLSPAINSMEAVTNVSPIYHPPPVWNLDEDYFRRIQAIEFAINNDDGKNLNAFQKADIILIGVSRTSKTPLSIYLAYHKFFVVNIPLIPEATIPNYLFGNPSKKIIGLSIHPKRLQEIRGERNTAMGVDENTNYSDLNHIIEELEFAQRIMKRVGCPIIDITNKAVEETAEIIMKLVKVKSNHLI